MGRTVTRILLDNNVQPVVIELNIETVFQLNADGVQAIYGDATSREVLRVAKIERAAGLIISTAIPEPGTIISAARDLNPQIRVLTRSTYLAPGGRSPEIRSGRDFLERRRSGSLHGRFPDGTTRRHRRAD